MKGKTAYLIKRKTMKIATRMMMAITVPTIIRMSCRLSENISWILRNDLSLIIAGPLESANSSILAVRSLF